MKSKLACGVALLSVVAFVSSTMACPGSKGCSCGAGAKTAAAKDSGSSIQKTVDTILASFPTMSFRVGDKTTTCSKSAAMMADETKASVKYVVGDEVFDNQADADAKLASLIDAQIEELETVKFAVGGKCTKCPVTAKKMAKDNNGKVAYRVAGVDFAGKDKAEKAVTLVKSALGGVSMAYKVGQKSFCCDKMAGDEVKKNGKSITYVVAGEETNCPISARKMFVRARVAAAVKAAMSAKEL